VATIAKRVGKLLGRNSRAAGLFDVDVRDASDGRAELGYQKFGDFSITPGEAGAAGARAVRAGGKEAGRLGWGQAWAASAFSRMTSSRVGMVFRPGMRS